MRMRTIGKVLLLAMALGGIAGGPAWAEASLIFWAEWGHWRKSPNGKRAMADLSLLNAQTLDRR